LRQLLRRERKQYGPQSGVVSFWQSRIGDFSDDAEQLVATSPAFHAGRVKCPILLLHGADDTTVWIEQSRIMEDALQKAGKPVQFVTLQGDDHYFTLPETRIRMLTELEAFLKKNIGN
jgi:dipeptidyl aminopeptidase/acylaminoacyl peptidase